MALQFDRILHTEQSFVIFKPEVILVNNNLPSIKLQLVNRCLDSLYKNNIDFEITKEEVPFRRFCIETEKGLRYYNLAVSEEIADMLRISVREMRDIRQLNKYLEDVVRNQTQEIKQLKAWSWQQHIKEAFKIIKEIVIGK